MSVLRSFAAIAALALAAQASAGPTTTSYVGTLADPQDAALIEFTVAVAGTVNFQTWGFGGGVNGAGTSIAAGGFDPYLSLFSGTGAGATFLASNEDGACPPGNTVSGLCRDSTLSQLLAAGDYTLAVTLTGNMSFAENLGSGTLGDGFIGVFTPDFFNNELQVMLTGDYAVDITTDAASTTGTVPEPQGLTLMVAALLAGVAAKRRRR
jgi:hypothetical protein